MPKLRQNLYWNLWPWPLTLIFCMNITTFKSNNSWNFHDNTMMRIRWWEFSEKGVTDSQTDRRNDWTIHRAAWWQLKIQLHFVKQRGNANLLFNLHTCTALALLSLWSAVSICSPFNLVAVYEIDKAQTWSIKFLTWNTGREKDCVWALYSWAHSPQTLETLYCRLSVKPFPRYQNGAYRTNSATTAEHQWMNANISPAHANFRTSLYRDIGWLQNNE